MDNYNQEFKLIDQISKLIESSFGIYGKSKLISQVFDDDDGNEEGGNEKNISTSYYSSSTNQIIFTNDGLTIFKSFNNDSPFYKIIYQQSNYIKERFGSGVSQYIILTNNLLKRSLNLIMNKGLSLNHCQILNTFKECRIFIKNNFNMNKFTINVKEIFLCKKEDDNNNFNKLQSIIKSNLSKNILSIYSLEISKVLKQLLKILPNLDKDKIKIKTIVSNGKDYEQTTTTTTTATTTTTTDDQNSGGNNDNDGDNFQIQLLDGILVNSTFTFAGRDKLVKEIDSPKILLLDCEIELKHQKEFAKIEIPSIDQYLEFVNIEKTLVSNQLERLYQSNINLIVNKKVIGDLAIQEFAKKKKDHKINCIGSLDVNEFESIKNSVGGCTQATLHSLSTDPLFYGTCKKYKQISIEKKSFELFQGCKNNSQTILLKGSSKKFLKEAKIGLESLLTTIRSIIIDDSFQLVGGSSSFEYIIINLLNQLINNKKEKQLKESSTFSSTNLVLEILIIKCLQKSIKDLIKLLIKNSNLNLDLIDQLFEIQDDKDLPCINILDNCIDNILNLNILESKSMKLSILNSAIETNSILLKTIST